MQKAGVSLIDLPKTNVFTSKLPPDPAFGTPEISHAAPRAALGPRSVKGAMYTFVRPERAETLELLDVSPKAMEDLGLSYKEKNTPEFKDMVAGNKIFWTEESGGIYPWAQCYGGWRLPVH
jgi:serine/tyrosine/threonine adenylyltransferase